MAATIINVNAVEDGTTRALNYVKEQEDTLESINRIVNTMEDAWDSEAQKAYADSCRYSRNPAMRITERRKKSICLMFSAIISCFK